MHKTIRIILAIIPVFAFALLFWPVVHDYGQTHGGILMRVNRFTGKTEYFITSTVSFLQPSIDARNSPTSGLPAYPLQPLFR